MSWRAVSASASRPGRLAESVGPGLEAGGGGRGLRVTVGRDGPLADGEGGGQDRPVGGPGQDGQAQGRAEAGGGGQRARDTPQAAIAAISTAGAVRQASSRPLASDPARPPALRAVSGHARPDGMAKPDRQQRQGNREQALESWLRVVAMVVELSRGTSRSSRSPSATVRGASRRQAVHVHGLEPRD